MLYYSAALLVGFLILFKSSDIFVIGSVATAKNGTDDKVGLVLVCALVNVPPMSDGTSDSPCAVGHECAVVAERSRLTV